MTMRTKAHKTYHCGDRGRQIFVRTPLVYTVPQQQGLYSEMLSQTKQVGKTPKKMGKQHGTVGKGVDNYMSLVA